MYRRHQRALHGRVWALEVYGFGRTWIYTGYRRSLALESARDNRRDYGYKVRVRRIL